MAERPDPDRDILREHEIDGIQEYDNDLPRWWLYTFYLSIVFAIGYGVWFHVLSNPLGEEAMLETWRDKRPAVLAERKIGMSEEELRALSHDPDRIAAGRELYFGKGTCHTCHGQEGEGDIGPNLRDDLWIYSSDMSTMFTSIKEGRNGKIGVMQSEPGGVSSKDEIISLAAFIADWNRSDPLPDTQHTLAPAGYEQPDPIDY